MEMIKSTGSWWKVVHPTQQIITILRTTIPVTHRRFDGDERVWYVHDTYADSLSRVIKKTGEVQEDPWALLHLRPGAPRAIITAAWRVLAKELHPDRGGDADLFVRVQRAYEQLMKE